MLVVIALVATGPFWAPLLPWAAGNEPAPEARIDRPKAAPQQSQQQNQPGETAANAASQRLDQRVGALEATPAAPASDIAEIRQQVATLAGTAADLAIRVEAIDKAIRSQAAVDPTDIALVLALLQIRDAIEAGRPFAAAYEALAALARARPEIAAAAVALAEPATSGLAGRPVLASRLRELAGAIATANAQANTPANAEAAAPGWADQAMSRLRGLVTIRRIDAAGQRQVGAVPSAAVNAALLALAGGDLEAAVGALEALTGTPAEAAGPWLHMAKARLAAEAALQRIEALLVARLGASANAPAGAGPPG
jgi:uroporphyrinogen-III synthase